MATRQLSPAAQLSAMLSRFPPEIVTLARRCLTTIRQAIPCTHEVIYDYSRSVVVSLGMSDRGYEAIAAVAIHPGEVRLYLDKSLPDPKGLLKGSGRKVRSVTLKNPSDLRGQSAADLRALLQAAAKHAGVESRAAGTTRKVIRPATKEKSLRRKTTTAARTGSKPGHGCRSR